MLVFKERGKQEYPEKNLWQQGREATANEFVIFFSILWDIKSGVKYTPSAIN